MVVNSMKRTNLEKKNILKAVAAFAVALAFIMPGASSIANDEITISGIDDGTFAGTIIYVDDSNTAGPWNGTIDYPYQYIQDGIDNATAGDTIIVMPGNYNEDLNINKANLIIRSESGKDITIIKLTGVVKYGIELNAGAVNTTIGGEAGHGFTITGPDTAPAGSFLISVNNAPSGIEISYNTIDTTGIASMGISVGAAGTSDLTITHNDFIGTDSGDGAIWLPHVDVFEVSWNTFTGAGKTNSGYQIETVDIQNAIIHNNTIEEGGMSITILTSDGGGTYGNTNNVFICDNVVNDSKYGILIYDVDANGNVANLVARHNTFTNGTYGVRIIGDGNQLDEDTIIINYNNIYGNINGFDNPAAEIDATNNYWGDETGPYHPTINPNGLGDNVSDNVEFVPWIGYYSWSVLLNIEEQYGIVGDTVIFGEKPDAIDGEDTYDAPKPPDVPPIPYVYAWFDAGLPEPYDQLWEDYRDYPDDYESWDLYIECNTTQPPLATVNLVVSWNTTDINATEYDHIRLYDASDVLLADMKAVGSYVFSAEFEYLYHFQIRCSMNVAPTAYNDFYTTGEDVTLTVLSPGVLGNDEDVENTPLIALLESDASNGTLTLNADGSFEYIPSIGFFGDDSFTYKANDGVDNSSTPATVTITVLDCHHVPLQQYWNLMSLPVSEPMDKNQIVIRSGGTDYTWSEAVSGHIILDNLYDWNTTTQCYAVESSTFKPGRAYWMWAYQNCELLIYINDVGTGDVSTLQLKWNLVGFPHDAPLVKENLVVNYEGVNYSWDEATTNDNPTGSPIVLKFLYEWEKTSQRYAYADSFDVGSGYWMYAYKTCNLINPLV